MNKFIKIVQLINTHVSNYSVKIFFNFTGWLPFLQSVSKISFIDAALFVLLCIEQVRFNTDDLKF
jgi:hypothetical protein